MKIVVGTDGSSFSASTESVLQRFSGLASADVHVVSVYQTPQAIFAPITPSADLMMAAEAASLADVLQSVSEQRSQEAADRLVAKGVSAHAHAECGETAAALIEFARSSEADLIMAGSKGEGALKGFLLGSVARNLAANSPFSVLLTRETKSEAGPSVLVAYDGSDGAKAVLEFVPKLGHLESITVVCCSPLSPLPPSLEPDLYELFITEDKERANNLAAEGAEMLRGAASKIVAERKSGRPAESIVEEAERLKCDLVIVGASRHGFLERLILGSVAYEVATNAPCSVLIVRPKA